MKVDYANKITKLRFKSQNKNLIDHSLYLYKGSGLNEVFTKSRKKKKESEDSPNTEERIPCSSKTPKIFFFLKTKSFFLSFSKPFLKKPFFFLWKPFLSPKKNLSKPKTEPPDPSSEKKSLFFNHSSPWCFPKFLLRAPLQISRDAAFIGLFEPTLSNPMESVATSNSLLFLPNVLSFSLHNQFWFVRFSLLSKPPENLLSHRLAPPKLSLSFFLFSNARAITIHSQPYRQNANLVVRFGS